MNPEHSARPADRDHTPAQILLRTLHGRSRGIVEGECADIVEAQLDALADAGHLVVSRADVRVAWSLAAKALAELPPGRLPGPSHRRDVEDALTRLYALLMYACPARRADERMSPSGDD